MQTVRPASVGLREDLSRTLSACLFLSFSHQEGENCVPFMILSVFPYVNANNVQKRVNCRSIRVFSILTNKHNESLPVDSYHVLWGELCLVRVAVRIRAFEDARLSDSVVTVLAECVPTFGEAVHAAFFAVFAY